MPWHFVARSSAITLWIVWDRLVILFRQKDFKYLDHLIWEEWYKKQVHNFIWTALLGYTMFQLSKTIQIMDNISKKNSR